MRLKSSLLMLRLSVALFFSIWIVCKLVRPDWFDLIWTRFYLVGPLSTSLRYAVGGFQCLVLMFFLLGLFKTWFYGALLVMHVAATLSTWKYLLVPFESDLNDMLLWASIPTLGGIVFLFLMREEDTLWNFRWDQD